MSETLAWRKSSYCSNGTCLEVAPSGENGNVYIRDSKQAHGAVLAFGHAAFADFLTGIKNGEYDLR